MSKPHPTTPSTGSTDDRLDEALDETFPASDPIAIDPEPDDDEPRDDTGKRPQ